MDQWAKCYIDYIINLDLSSPCSVVQREDNTVIIMQAILLSFVCLILDTLHQKMFTSIKIKFAKSLKIVVYIERQWN